MNNPVGIYIHIPFCAKRCAYCDFYSGVGIEFADVYEKALIKHIKTFKGIKCDTVYFGGGTPTYFGADRLCRVLDAVKESFEVDENAEITAECNPKTATLEDFVLMKRCGFNRLSIGMQSANENELSALGRIHTADDVKNTVLSARCAGFDNISLDLMYGIPYQTVKSFEKTLEFTLSLAPKHVSAYMLKLEEGTMLFENADKYRFPSEDDVIEMTGICGDRLSDSGIERYEISNYAQKGFESRHNLKYWHRDEYISFGPSASSFYNGRRYTYTPDVHLYTDYCLGSIEENAVLDEEEFPNKKDAECEYIMLNLRLSDGVSKSEYRKLTGKDFDEYYGEKVKKYCSLGLMVNGDSVRFTDKGFAVSNAVLCELLEF